VHDAVHQRVHNVSICLGGNLRIPDKQEHGQMMVPMQQNHLEREEHLNHTPMEQKQQFTGLRRTTSKTVSKSSRTLEYLRQQNA
jgi:hypothetical protein